MSDILQRVDNYLDWLKRLGKVRHKQETSLLHEPVTFGILEFDDDPAFVSNKFSSQSHKIMVDK